MRVLLSCDKVRKVFMRVTNCKSAKGLGGLVGARVCVGERKACDKRKRAKCLCSCA